MVGRFVWRCRLSSVSVNWNSSITLNFFKLQHIFLYRDPYAYRTNYFSTVGLEHKKKWHPKLHRPHAHGRHRLRHKTTTAPTTTTKAIDKSDIDTDEIDDKALAHSNLRGIEHTKDTHDKLPELNLSGHQNHINVDAIKSTEKTLASLEQEFADKAKLPDKWDLDETTTPKLHSKWNVVDICLKWMKNGCCDANACISYRLLYW